MECVNMKVDGRVSVRSEKERKDKVFTTYEMYWELAGT